VKHLTRRGNRSWKLSKIVNLSYVSLWGTLKQAVTVLLLQRQTL